MAPMKEKKTEVLTVRITPSAKKALESLANKDERSVSQLAWRFISEGIARAKKS